MDSSPDLATLAKEIGLSQAALQTLLAALVRGGGSQAQFDHPDLGGHGQWMRGGMLMIGDMFNDALKARVAKACEQLAPLARNVEASPIATPPMESWWPQALGHPKSAASQDGLSYALFANPNRIAVRSGDEVKVYDVGDAIPHGVGMQNGKIVVHTRNGAVALYQLRVVQR